MKGKFFFHIKTLPTVSRAESVLGRQTAKAAASMGVGATSSSSRIPGESSIAYSQYDCNKSGGRSSPREHCPSLLMLAHLTLSPARPLWPYAPRRLSLYLGTSPPLNSFYRTPDQDAAFDPYALARNPSVNGD